MLANGKQRPLGIPTVKTRAVQMAVVLVLGPNFEADLPPEQYAYHRRLIAHAVCKWIGNSHAVAAKHCLQVTEAHYDAAQNAAQSVPESRRERSQSQSTCFSAPKGTLFVTILSFAKVLSD